MTKAAEQTMPPANAPRPGASDVLTEETIEAVKAELRETDGEPLESPWHRAAINLMIDVVLWRRRGQTNFFVGGNMFIYYSRTQARRWDYKGPDFFFVNDVDGTRERLYWWTFEEDGKFPNLIMELLSPTTAVGDRTTKKDLYERTFQTPEYLCYDPETRKLDGWRLQDGRYRPITPNDKGWLWSQELEAWVGTWEGVYLGNRGSWPRFFDSDGNLMPTEAEDEKRRAEEAWQRAEQERQRAEALQAQLNELQALLKEKGITPQRPA
jgi:Uma2 family endonuclease